MISAHCVVSLCSGIFFIFFFFNDTATTEIYTLSLHDALPISCSMSLNRSMSCPAILVVSSRSSNPLSRNRSEEHTSELQSRRDLVCRLLLEKKKKTTIPIQLHRPITH